METGQDGVFPATLWGQEYEMEFVKDHLGPALEKASPDTKIWILDHNYNLWGRDLPGIAHVAAENADGSRELVMANNDSSEQRAQCTLAARALNLVLPPDSITSLVWS